MQYQPQEPHHFYDTEYSYNIEDAEPYNNISTNSAYQPAPSTYRHPLNLNRSGTVNRSYSRSKPAGARAPTPLPRVSRSRSPGRVSFAQQFQDSDSGFASEPDNIDIAPASYSEFDYGGEGVMPHRDHGDTNGSGFYQMMRTRAGNYYSQDLTQIPLIFQYLILVLLLVWCFSVTDAQSSSQQNADIGIPLSDLFRLAYWMIRFTVGFVAKVLLMLGLPGELVWAMMGLPPMLMLGYFVLVVL